MKNENEKTLDVCMAKTRQIVAVIIDSIATDYTKQLSPSLSIQIKIATKSKSACVQLTGCGWPAARLSNERKWLPEIAIYPTLQQLSPLTPDTQSSEANHEDASRYTQVKEMWA